MVGGPVERLTEVDLRAAAAILVCPSALATEAPRFVADADLAARSRLLVDLRDLQQPSVIAQVRTSPLPSLLLAPDDGP